MRKPKKNGIVANLAFVVVTLISIIAPHASAEQKQPTSQVSNDKNAGKISIENSQNIVTGSIDAKGDVIVGGSKVTNIYAFPDYQDLVEQIKGLEQDLKDIPSDKIVSRVNIRGTPQAGAGF